MYRSRRPLFLSAEQQHHQSIIISDELHQKLRDGDTSPLSIDGYVLSKRSFGKALAFVDVVTADNVLLFQAMLKKQEYRGSCYDGYRKSLLPGTLMRIEGVASPTRNPTEAVLLIQNMTLLQLPHQPQHINTILSLGSENEIPWNELVKSSCVPEKDLEEQLSQHKSFKSFAKQIGETLPSLPQPIADQLDQSGRGMRNTAPLFSREIPSSLKKEPTNCNPPKSPIKTIIDGTSVTRDISTVGWVQNRRRYGNNVTVLQLVEEIVNHSQDDAVGVEDGRLETILHPDVLDGADIYGNILTVGSRIWLSGEVHTRSDVCTHCLWVRNIRLLTASWRPITIRYILDQVYEGQFSPEEAAEALIMTESQLEQVMESDDLTERQWLANQLSNKIQSAKSRVANIAPEFLKVVDQYDNLRKQFPLQHTEIPEAILAEQWNSGSSGSKWQRQKRPQLLWMIHQISHLIERRRPASPSVADETTFVLDIGGGKGSLANSLARHAGKTVQVHVLDIAEGAINNGMKKARRLRLPNVEYQVADASEKAFVPPERVDVVVALHACGHLSDVALGHAVQNEADFCIVPCCFSSNPHLRVFDTPVEEFLGVKPAEWSALKSKYRMELFSRFV